MINAMDMIKAISLLKSFGYTIEHAKILESAKLDKNAQDALLLNMNEEYKRSFEGYPLCFIAGKTLHYDKTAFKNFLNIIQILSNIHKEKVRDYANIFKNYLNHFHNSGFKKVISFLIKNEDILQKCTVQTFSYIVYFHIKEYDNETNNVNKFIDVLNQFSITHNIQYETVFRIHKLLSRKFHNQTRYEIMIDILNNPIHPNLYWVDVDSNGMDFFYKLLYSKDFQKWNKVLKIHEMNVNQIKQWFKLIKNFDIKVANVVECAFWGYMAKHHQLLQNINEREKLSKIQTNLYILWKVFIKDKDISLDNHLFDIFCHKTNNYQIKI